MFINKPFEQFCRDHFVNGDGKVEDLGRSKGRLAEKRKKQLQVKDILSELRPLQAKLNILDEEIKRAKQNNKTTTIAYQKASGIRKRIGELKRYLKKLKGNDGKLSSKAGQRAD